jgi:two-component system phosphate regulon sensor histidine kinase PhoR
MGGTGLGLAIVKHIIGRHRGRLRIESEPGQGSEFRVVLPRE